MLTHSGGAGSRVRFVVVLAAATFVLGVGAGPAMASGVHLTSIAITPTTASLAPSQTQAFQAIGTFSDHSTQDITSSVQWSSKVPAVATINSAGVATAVSSGETDINAMDPTTRVTSRSPAKLTVATLKSLTISPSSGDIRGGESLALKAQGSFDNGATVDVTQLAQWTSASPAIATVGDGTSDKGVTTGVSAGTATITATDKVGGNHSTCCSAMATVTVLEHLSAVTVSPAKHLLQVGQSTHYQALGTFENNTKIDITADVTWASSNPSVASIDTTGRAKALAIGSASISATDKATGVSSTSSGGNGTLTVVGALTSLQVTPTTVSRPIGQTKSLKALATYQGNSSTFNVSSKVIWSSSNTAVVTVTTKGAATCVGAGTATVSVKDPKTGLTSTATGGDSTITCH